MKLWMLISQPFMNRLSPSLYRIEGENGGYMPKINLEGYEGRVINYGRIYFRIDLYAGEFGCSPIGNFSINRLASLTLSSSSLLFSPLSRPPKCSYKGLASGRGAPPQKGTATIFANYKRPILNE